ncbi:MAG: DUF86 domain-containing protein [Flavobacterium sp.]|nr:DUF86 domain-containing protein [Flavobacterium sp.]
MKHRLDDKARIIHILEAISDIEIFLEGINLETFLNSKEKSAAVERKLEIIGEASNHISEKILYHPAISAPWRKIIGTRNLIVHEYFRIDYNIIYQIAKEDIIPLKQEIQNILKDLDQYLK